MDLVVSCGAEDLRRFLEKLERMQAIHPKYVAVVELVEAVGIWAEESLLKCLHQASNFSIMADECTNVTTIEERSILSCWVEDGVPVEHFLEVAPLKATDARTIYFFLVEFMKDKSIHISKLVGTGFDGAATFSRKHSSVQTPPEEEFTSWLCSCTAMYFNLPVFK